MYVVDDTRDEISKITAIWLSKLIQTVKPDMFNDEDDDETFATTEYGDGGNHNCDICLKRFPLLSIYLEHLHTKSHLAVSGSVLLSRTDRMSC